MEYENLKLENQICFPVYAASRLITREYQPLLDKLGITYPQYLVLMVLWENDRLQVNDIAKKLILNTNTITPLLKRMEKQGLIIRKRSEQDERSVLVRDGDELLKSVARLGQIHHPIVLLHDPNVLQIEHVGPLGHHHRLRAAFGRLSHHDTGNGAIWLALDSP